MLISKNNSKNNSTKNFHIYLFVCLFIYLCIFCLFVLPHTSRTCFENVRIIFLEAFIILNRYLLESKDLWRVNPFINAHKVTVGHVPPKKIFRTCCYFMWLKVRLTATVNRYRQLTIFQKTMLDIWSCS